MGQVLLLLVVALTVAAVVFGVTVLVTGSDSGLGTAEPDGRAVPLPGNRPLLETDVGEVRFDLALRGYRMAQVDHALRRTAYDIGYKDELIGVLQAEVTALREGRLDDAEVLRRAREAALVPVGSAGAAPDAAVDGSSARTLAAAATTGGIGVHSSPVPSVSGSADVADGGPSGSQGGSGLAEPAPLEFQQVDFGPEPSTRPEPAAAAESAARPPTAAESAAPSTDDRADDRADDAEPAAPTRSVRSGGSVIEAEDGDLAEPTPPIRPAVGAGSSDRTGGDEHDQPTGPTQAGASAEPGEPATGNVESGEPATGRPAGSVGRPGPADAADESDESAGEAPTTRVRPPTKADGAGGPSGPAEQPERA
ncbi:hypothetical protein GCM10022225_22630 [Plantactinospora mayteni]|uniref:DivIVA domain-containing protein n=1 Tax=Plantactinospora mayteni TaxID=566021 RepID=A0ABQ4EP72_9ACTN|nr:hypothetical protein Pma05_30180 [Plantactinospora mayteni]